MRLMVPFCCQLRETILRCSAVVAAPMWVAVAAVLAGTGSAQAVPIFSQMPVSNLEATESDREGVRRADDFTVAVAGTARRVTWRGVYLFDGTPQFPAPFDLTIFEDAAGLPGNVLSTVSVNVTGVDTGLDTLSQDIYEFVADLTPTPLSAGTTYWFSAVGDTAGDSEDAFYWTTGFSGGLAANQIGGAWSASGFGPYYFILDDEPLVRVAVTVPEPATVSLGLLGLAGLMMRRRRVV